MVIAQSVSCREDQPVSGISVMGIFNGLVAEQPIQVVMIEEREIGSGSR